ncbi:MAG: SH3 domain-containing protein, partial [Anaerovoracaceae bacterium]|jgi:uncharacterized protein YgiM (DUF1202 family)
LHTTASGEKWYRVYTSSKNGYILAKDVKLTTPPAPPKDTYTGYSPKKQGVTLVDMNVRSAPSSSASRIGSFKKDTTLKLDGLHTTASGEKWYRVYTSSKNGYILAKDVKLTTPPAPPKDTYTGYSPKKEGITLADMNVLSGPYTSAGRVGSFKKDTTLKLDGLHITASGEKWYRVYTNSKYGYIPASKIRLATGSGLSLSSNVSKPGTIQKGSSFVLRGSINSKYRMNNVVIGVKSSSGTWISGKYVSVNPNATSYDIARVDAAIKFGTLAEGSYYYCIYAKDVNGYSKTLLNHSFSVKGTTPPTLITGEMGTTLSYKTSVITSIGKQPYSGPCGIYAMAYCRGILDGSFTKGVYGSIHKRIIGEYGNGTNYAHWWKAGGSNIYHTTNSSCYREVYKQINMGKPCIILVRNGYTGNTHYVTVIGYTKGTTASNVNLGRLIAIDPAYGVVKYLGNMRYYDHPDAQMIKF